MASINLIKAHCSQCGIYAGKFENKWIQVTNSYFFYDGFVSANPSNAESEIGRILALENQGIPRPPSGSNKEFENCVIQPLQCQNCSGKLAFYCVEAPADKQNYQGLTAFRLAKFKFFDVDGGPAEPHIQYKSLLGLKMNDRGISGHAVSMREARPQPTAIASAPPSGYQPADSATQKLNDADRAAVQATNEAHERWASATRENLSPAAFAKHIMDLGGGNHLRQRQSPPSHSTVPTPAPAPVTARPNGNGPSWDGSHATANWKAPPVRGTTWKYYHAGPETEAPRTQSIPVMQHAPTYPIDHTSSTSASLHDAISRQQVDISRLETQLSQLQTNVDHLTKLVENMSKTRPPPDSGNKYGQYPDPESFELLSETVSNLAPKVGEIDSIKLNIDSMKRRLRRLEPGEDNQLTTPVSAEYPAKVIDERPLIERIRSTEDLQQNIAPPSYSIMQDDGPRDGQHKYQRLAPRGDGQMRGGFTPNSISRKRGRPPKASSPYASEGVDVSFGRQDNWLTELPMSEDDTSLHQVPDTNIERGKVVRRGSGVGFGEQPLKRTRQKPIRMPDGSLMRKDGLPDKRSTSSALNLKKKVDKYREHLPDATPDYARGSNGVSMEPTPKSNEHSPEESNNSSHKGTGADVSSEQANTSDRDHQTIMKKMFPRGLSEETRRMDHARNIFSSNRSPEREKIQPRREMQKDEIAQSPQDARQAEETVGGGAETAIMHKPLEMAAREPDEDIEMTDRTAASANPTSVTALKTFAEPPPQRTAEIKALANIREEQRLQEQWEESQLRREESNGYHSRKPIDANANQDHSSEESYHPKASKEP